MEQNITTFESNPPPVEVSFAPDKRPFRIYLAVILGNVLFLLFSFGGKILVGSFNEYLFVGISVGTLFATIIAVWLSGIQTVWKKYVLLGVFGYWLLTTTLWILCWFANICGDEAYANFIEYTWYLQPVPFFLAYGAGFFLRNRNGKILVYLIGLETLFIIGLLGFWGYYAYETSFIETAITDVPLTEAVRLCDSVKFTYKVDDCWDQVIRANPGVDVCALSKNRDPKSECFYATRRSYLTVFNCERKSFRAYVNEPYHLSVSPYGLEEKTKEEAQLNECWDKAAKRYPGLDICAISTDGSKTVTQACVDFFRTRR